MRPSVSYNDEVRCARNGYTRCLCAATALASHQVSEVGGGGAEGELSTVDHLALQ